MGFSGNGYSTASTVITSEGDLRIGDSSGNAERLAIGSSGKVLESDGSTASWETPSGSPTTTKGDLSGFSTLSARIPIGTNNYTILADSAQALGLKYAASATSILAAAGDILYASSANVLAKLAKATDGDTLQLASGVPAWVTVAAAGGVVTGSIVPYGGAYDDSVSGYLQCNGDAVSRTTYSDLFGVTSTQFGVGDGSSTFNVPDFNSKFARGAPSSTSCGATGGADTVSLSEAELASHTHTASVTDGGHVHSLYRNNGGSGDGAVQTITGSAQAAHIIPAPPVVTATTGITVANSSTGSGTAHQNMPSYLEILYIIKT